MAETEETTIKDVNAFFQRPQFDAFERLICSHLIEAVNAPPLDIVTHITYAALSIKNEQAKNYEIDTKITLSLYTVAQRIATAVKNTDRWGDVTYRVGLDTLSWDTDIKPWRRPQCYAWSLEDGESEQLTCALDAGDEQKAFNISAKTLSPGGYANMTSDFLLYAIPIVMQMSRKLSALVSPETYTELMKLYHGDKA